MCTDLAALFWRLLTSTVITSDRDDVGVTNEAVDD
jgi:hypothetical protein